MRSSMSRTLGLCVVSVLMMAACGGPRVPLEVGVKELATDVLLGGPKIEPAPPPPPALSPSPGFPALPAEVEEFEFPEFEEPPPPACPPANPLDAPKREVRSRPEGTIAAAAYVFRNEGTFEGPSGSGSYRPESRRVVQNVMKQQVAPGVQDTGVFRFQVVDELTNLPITTTYRVVPTENAQNPLPGIFVESIEQKTTAGGTDRFAPQPPLRLMAFPAEPGADWSAGNRGIDPLSGTVYEITEAHIGVKQADGSLGEPKTRVNACGEPLDAWVVEIRGRIQSPTRNLVIHEIYAFGLQFGGLSLMDTKSVTGTQGGKAVNNRNQATINMPPNPPT